MLEELQIRNVGVIDEAGLTFGPGLNVLTGETGAGKTMVVHALELLLGARADAGQVRHGAGTALVEGRIHPVPPAGLDWLGEGDDALVASREVSAEASGSRSRARLGGRLAPVSALAEVIGAVVDIHGQHESVRLGQPALQRELLDRSGGAGLAGAREAYRAAWTAWGQARDELEGLRGGERERARELDRVRFELAEIDAAAPEPDEDERIEAELARLEHAESLTQAAALAAAALGDEGGARDGAGAAVAALRAIQGVDPALDQMLGRAEAAATELQDLVFELGGYREGLELDPQRLESLRERRALLAELTWKYGAGGAPRGSVDTGALLAHAEQLRARVEELESGDERAGALERRAGELDDAAERAAVELRRLRVAAGERLADRVRRHLAELAMDGAALHVQVEPAERGPNGADRVTFLLAANPGEPALPLGKAASGGEQSRVALAVRLALADADDTPVLVFDEVDAGIGGAVAQAVGQKLAELARGRQVLCVTHLAQLAAFADVHFAVSKRERDGRTVAEVRPLEEDERVVELSRMLSGSPDSALAAGHAAELRQAARAAIPAS